MPLVTRQKITRKEKPQLKKYWASDSASSA